MFKCKSCKEKDKYINELENEIENLKIFLNLYKNENKELRHKGYKFIEWQNKKKKPKNKIKINIDLIFHLKAHGKSNRKIAEYFGVSEGTIRNRINEYNKSKSELRNYS